MGKKRNALFGVLASGCVKNNVSKGQLVTVIVDNEKPGGCENGVMIVVRKKAVLTHNGKGGT